MIRIKIPITFKFQESLPSIVFNDDIHRLYSIRRQIEDFCQSHFAASQYHVLIERVNLNDHDVEAFIYIDFKNEDDAVLFKLCYLEKK